MASKIVLERIEHLRHVASFQYSENLIITRRKNRSLNTSYKDIAPEMLYKMKRKRMENEPLNIVKTADEIILQDIRTKSVSFPSSDMDVEENIIIYRLSHKKDKT